MASVFDLEKKFSRETKEIKNESDKVISQTDETEHNLSGRPTCTKCGDSDWWQTHYSDNLICRLCDPPSLDGLVGRMIAFDDSGDAWDVRQSEDEIRYTKCSTRQD